jgi:transcriptional regulator with XRE-family HTH domain
LPKSQFSEAYTILVAALRQARQEAGLTQTELAERIGRKQGHVSIIETGVRRIDVIEFCAIARAIGRDPVELFAQIYDALPEHLDV